jgi:predicted RNA-binding protein with PIN domain
MLLLIDAYNLLHQSDALQRNRGAGWLGQARERLIRHLAGHLGADLASQTCLVFDSRIAPAGLPAITTRHSIEVRFAVDHEEADDLLEEMIARHPTPKRLMVVSSDHRVQRAAARRQAKFADSDRWYANLQESRIALAVPWPPPAATLDPHPHVDKPAPPTDEAELQAWLRTFSATHPELSSSQPLVDAADREASMVPGANADDANSAAGTASEPIIPIDPLPQGRRAGKRTVRGRKPLGATNEDHAAGTPRPNAEGAKSSDASPQPSADSRGRARHPGRAPKKNKHDDSKIAGLSHQKPDPSQPLDADLANPFPEGYAEDLLDP